MNCPECEKQDLQIELKKDEYVFKTSDYLGNTNGYDSKPCFMCPRCEEIYPYVVESFSEDI